MIRQIVGWHRDEVGDWVAELSCLHNQHVRHRPPFQERPWVQTHEGRGTRLGTEIECPLCDRAELPEGLRLARTAGPFDQDSLPAGLRRDHRVAERTWGRLRVTSGSVGFAMGTDPPVERRLEAGDDQPIPPGVPHALRVGGPVTLQVDFLVAPGP
ncbi:MAG TPA: DUF3565 domain-containing protein [Acidimicrobiales bacterium]|nr:DUF3565 domain-containing protein [Acidimicrobiales bacterium]